MGVEGEEKLGGANEPTADARGRERESTETAGARSKFHNDAAPVRACVKGGAARGGHRSCAAPERAEGATNAARSPSASIPKFRGALDRSPRILRPPLLAAPRAQLCNDVVIHTAGLRSAATARRAAARSRARTTGLQHGPRHDWTLRHSAGANATHERARVEVLPAAADGRGFRERPSSAAARADAADRRRAPRWRSRVRGRHLDGVRPDVLRPSSVSPIATDDHRALARAAFLAHAVNARASSALLRLERNLVRRELREQRLGSHDQRVAAGGEVLGIELDELVRDHSDAFDAAAVVEARLVGVR